MKKCLKCNRNYSDDTLNYCLDDGTTLVFEDERATVVVQKSPERKSGRMFLWLGLIGLTAVGGIGLIGAFLLYNYLTSSPDFSNRKQNTVNVSPSPGNSTTAKNTPVANTDSTPKVEEKNNTDEEITPITWHTSTTQFKGEDGQIYKFECPPNGTAGAIWGSDIYTGDSSICTAAVHAGLFTLESGGIVTVEYRPGRQTYGSTERHGITSNTYGEYSRSFVVR
jgi:hypothetical protein